MFLLRVLLPDRPGSLGTVATALGTVDADIHAIEIVEHRPDQTAVDDFIVQLPPGVLPDRLVSACQTVEGVEVLWFARYAGAVGLRFDLELVEQLAEHPESATDTLVGQLPDVLQVDWAMLTRSDGTVVSQTEAAPQVTKIVSDWFTASPADRKATRIQAAAPLDDLQLLAAPMGKAGVVIARRGGPEFFDSEVARFRYLTHVCETLVG